MTFVTLQRRDLIVSEQIVEFENLDGNIQLKFGIFVFNEFENYDDVNSSTYIVHDDWFIRHNEICDLISDNVSWALFVFRSFVDTLAHNVVSSLIGFMINIVNDIVLNRMMHDENNLVNDDEPPLIMHHQLLRLGTRNVANVVM